ncbi:phosphoadenosine phosphosulfate reductase [Aliiroseovarius sp. 2305UL8-7]|uniref:phosphoadenosine phosphosulfate reductase n=1 Tax=Aliiroseovarius conchicola TaxID=3121637 RepID=UPI0035278D61
MLETPSDRKQKWRENFESVAAEGGFFKELSSEHKALYVEQGKTLVVAFENLDDARQDTENRLPWGMDFLTSHGWSAIGIMAHGHTWYRDPAVSAFFDQLGNDGFFSKFDRVVFYGVSMGGYAATAYASACPGADVIAVNPQATLSRNVTLGWENRFKPAWRRDYGGPYGYGPDGVRAAGKVRLFYDPTIAADAIHATLYTGANVEKIRCRNMGHGMLTTWRHMGVLSTIIKGCITGSITEAEIYAHLTARKRNPYYQKRLLSQLLRRNRPYWVSQYCNAVLEDCAPQKRPHFRNAMIEANKKLGRS